jgi:dipeptidyl aminopeptidase/acylaminoacyl peptidase
MGPHKLLAAFLTILATVASTFADGDSKATAGKAGGPKTKQAATSAAKTGDSIKSPVAKPEPARETVKKERLTLEKLFPKKGLFGPTAHGMSFSHDGNYAAYLYHHYEERRHGVDLWVLEVATGKTERVTAPAVMAKFQASARKVQEDRAKKLKSKAPLLESLVRQFTAQGKTGRVKLVLDSDADDAKAPRYSGIHSFRWSPTANELLFVSEWDIYRWKVGDKEPVRQTKTKAQEWQVRYLQDGAGYTYLVGGALMRVVFGSHLIEQLDPPLPHGESMVQYRISPDGKRLAFRATKRGTPAAPDRKVSIANYRERFMKVQEVPRHVSEDPLPPVEESIYLYDLTDGMVENGPIAPVFHHNITGPRDLISLPDWSPDSRRIVFAVFEQTSGQVRIMQAEIEPDPKAGARRAQAKPARVIYRFLHTGGPNTPGMIDPHFLDDNRRIALITEQSGFRQLHILDPLYESLEQVTFGRYEVYPIRLSKDRKTYFVAATREHPACRDVYRVSLAGRSMERLTRGCGVYESVAVSPDGKTILANFERYGSLRELVRVDCGTGCQKTLTDSHPESTRKLTTVRPELFSYKNRQGHEIQGMLFKPEGWSKNDKRPLLIYVYGGPLGTRKLVVEGAYQSDAYLFARYMTEKHGYVTCTIDPRGVSGYGSLFEKANFQQVGKPQVEDLVDGVKHFIANYGVDPKRVGIHGWSFGGFQTQMCLYTQPDVFAVGIAGAGPTEWENYNSWYSTATIGSTRMGQPDLSKFSLLPLAKNLKARLLLVHGMEDSNVLYQDTVRVYRELLKAGKETLVELFLDPTGGHGLGGDVKPLALRRKYEDFLIRFLGKGEPAKLPLTVQSTNPTANTK